LTDKTAKSLVSRRKLQSLFGITPTVKELKVGIKSFKENEFIVYKVLIDLITSYISVFEGPTKTTYIREILPLRLRFHCKLSENQTLAMNADLRQMIEEVGKEVQVNRDLSEDGVSLP